MIRHPFDVLASGRRRAATTANWRPLSVEEHCRYLSGAYRLARDLADNGVRVELMRWEEMLLDRQDAAAAGSVDRSGAS